MFNVRIRKLNDINVSVRYFEHLKMKPFKCYGKLLHWSLAINTFIWICMHVDPFVLLLFFSISFWNYAERAIMNGRHLLAWNIWPQRLRTLDRIWSDLFYNSHHVLQWNNQMDRIKSNYSWAKFSLSKIQNQ